MKISAGWLDSRKLPRNRPPKRQEEPIDGHEGMYAWVYPSGTVVFVYRYTRPGTTKRRKMRLGEYGDSGISLEKAFDLHREAQRWLEEKLDPIDERDRRESEKQKAREAREGAGTVTNLVEQFIHRKLRAERWDAELGVWVRDEKTKIKARKRPDAAAIVLGYRQELPPRRRKARSKLVPSLVSELGHIKLCDLTKRQLVQFFDSVVDRGASVGANRIYTLAKQMFEWAAAKDLIPASPMAGIERPGGEETPRDRVLSVDEVKAFWTKLETAEMAEPTQLALKLLLVTAQRRGELTFAKWSHFDLDAKAWTIPVELLKSSHTRRERPPPHVVPLSPLALEILRELHKLTGEGPYALPAHASKRKPIPYSEAALSRAVRQNREHFGIPEWTPHDLRRTAASFMTKLGIPRLHVEKVLNHSTGDIAEVYDRHDYLPEKRAALEKWGEHLQAIIERSEHASITSERAA
ncbi:MAG: tyrosine-type recombinase/integrase [Steroidobacteraceae bacterium]